MLDDALAAVFFKKAALQKWVDWAAKMDAAKFSNVQLVCLRNVPAWPICRFDLSIELQAHLTCARIYCIPNEKRNAPEYRKHPSQKTNQICVFLKKLSRSWKQSGRANDEKKSVKRHDRQKRDGGEERNEINAIHKLFPLSVNDISASMRIDNAIEILKLFCLQITFFGFQILILKNNRLKLNQIIKSRRIQNYSKARLSNQFLANQ